MFFALEPTFRNILKYSTQLSAFLFHDKLLIILWLFITLCLIYECHLFDAFNDVTYIEALQATVRPYIKIEKKSIILLITKLITGKGIFLMNSKLSETRLIFTLFFNRSFGMFLSRGGGERVTTKTEQGGVNERV